MGQNYGTPSPNESTAQALQSYIQYLPQLLNVMSAQTPQLAQTQQNVEAGIAPQAQNLETNLYANSAPQLYDIGNQLNAQQSQAGISQALNNLNSTQGQQLSQAAITADQQANPQYYQNVGAAGNQLTNLLNSINLNGLTGSENAQVARAVAQQDAQKGILNSPSQTATVANAMQFGTALQQKQANLANAINTATSFLPSSRSGVNTFNVGTGAATTQSNPGANEFLGTQNNATNNATSNATSSSNNLLSNITGQQNNANQLISSQGINSSIPSLMSSVPT